MSTQLTLSQAATALKVSEKSIRRYIKAGRLKAQLVKGDKGYEYRIDKDKLKILEKPLRGKLSHKVSINQKNKKTRKQEFQVRQKKQTSPKEYTPHMDSLSQLAEEKYQKILRMSQNDMGAIDYKLLYEKLLAKYEQSLIMIGSLEAQVKNLRANANRGDFYSNYNSQPKQIPSYSGDTIAKNEEMILELYQMLRNERDDSYGM